MRIASASRFSIDVCSSAIDGIEGLSSYRGELKITGETRALSLAGYIAERLITGSASVEGADRDFKRAAEGIGAELTKGRADELVARTKQLIAENRSMIERVRRSCLTVVM